MLVESHMHKIKILCTESLDSIQLIDCLFRVLDVQFVQTYIDLFIFVIEGIILDYSWSKF